nr:DUF3052 domain-containing protein [uncultured Dyadobacter sp.]
MNPAGYSRTPLVKKLGLKAGMKVRLVDPPQHYFELLETLPADINFLEEARTAKDLIHYFTSHAASLTADMAALKLEIVPDGVIWVSWPKKASKVPTDVTEDVIRNLALAHGLVDVKVCAVDAVWSGLKLVIPVKNRK